MYTPYVTPEEYGTLGSGSILPEKLQNAPQTGITACRRIDIQSHLR